jgi:phenylacetic acid degradation operon negative regulatory protein
VRQAWALDDVAGRYTEFAARFQAARPRSPDQTFAAQVHLVHEWRRFPFLDPSLPRELLPLRWPGLTAVDLFDRRHSEWHQIAQRYWTAVCAAEEDRT